MSPMTSLQLSIGALAVVGALVLSASPSQAQRRFRQRSAARQTSPLSRPPVNPASSRRGQAPPRNRAAGPRIAEQLRAGMRIEPHLHFEGTVRGARLMNLASREGDLRKGLRALGLSDRPADLPRSRREAARMLDISRNPIDIVYTNLSKFRGAAFDTPARYASWLRAAVTVMNRNADITYVQIRPARVANILNIARDHNVDLGGVRFLLGVHRTRGLDAAERRTIVELLRRHPQRIVGLDLLGEETSRQRPGQIRELVGLLHASGHSSRVLRLHEGEGVDNAASREVVRGNVNIALGALRRSLRGTDRSLQVILGHATHVDSVPVANRHLRALKSMGVDVFVNPNPLANMMWGSVRDPGQIRAAQLDAPTLVGTDNVGTLRSNMNTWRQLRSGETELLNHRVRGYRAVAERRQANPQAGTSAPPPGE